jgi:methionine-S-sulfoxide reductase
MLNLPENTQTATFAGGCFWCTESDFESLPGVLAVVSGYTGGLQAHPTYHQVCSGKTGHTEAVQVYYNPDQVDYPTLLDRFWRMIDPTDAGGQFVDRGSQYRTAIFYHDDEQKRLAEQSLALLNQSNRFAKPVATSIVPLADFYPAEEYHQDYYKKSPERYHAYRTHSGRDRALAHIWRDVPPPPGNTGPPVPLHQTRRYDAAPGIERDAISGHAAGGHGTALRQYLLGQQIAGDLCGYRFRGTPVQFHRQIRFRYRVAQFHPTTGSPPHRGTEGSASLCFPD